MKFNKTFLIMSIVLLTSIGFADRYVNNNPILVSVNATNYISQLISSATTSLPWANITGFSGVTLPAINLTNGTFGSGSYTILNGNLTFNTTGTLNSYSNIVSSASVNLVKNISVWSAVNNGTSVASIHLLNSNVGVSGAIEFWTMMNGGSETPRMRIERDGQTTFIGQFNIWDSVNPVGRIFMATWSINGGGAYLGTVNDQPFALETKNGAYTEILMHQGNVGIGGNIQNITTGTFAGQFSGSTMFVGNWTTPRVGINTIVPSYPLDVKTNVSGISVYSEGNISASGYITRTSIFQGQALPLIQNYTYYIDSQGKVNHTRYGISAVNYNKTIVTEYINMTYTDTTGKNATILEPITGTVSETGISLDMEVSLLKQAIYELKIQSQQPNVTSIILANGGKIYSNSTCTIMTSPNGKASLMVCNP